MVMVAIAQRSVRLRRVLVNLKNLVLVEKVVVLMQQQPDWDAIAFWRVEWIDASEQELEVKVKNALETMSHLAVKS